MYAGEQLPIIKVNYLTYEQFLSSVSMLWLELYAREQLATIKVNLTYGLF